MKKKTRKYIKKLGITFPLSQAVEIRWEDACGLSGWNNQKDFVAQTGMAVSSVGYLVKKDKKYITIVQSQSQDEGMAAGLTIPLSWLVSVRPIK